MNGFVVLVWLSIIGAAIAGWVMNLLNVLDFIGQEVSSFTGYMFLQVLGLVPATPLGPIMGWISYFN